MEIKRDQVTADNLLSLSEFKEKRGWGESLTYDEFKKKRKELKLEPQSVAWEGKKFCSYVSNATIAYQFKPEVQGLDFVKIGNDRFVYWNDKAKNYTPGQNYSKPKQKRVAVISTGKR